MQCAKKESERWDEGSNLHFTFHKYTCMYIHIHMRACMRACVQMQLEERGEEEGVCTYINKSMHVHMPTYMHAYRMQLDDAKKEYERGGEGSELRLARCHKQLAEVVSLGSDADLGLTDFANLRSVIQCVMRA
jgi:hypothetical protein